jgi:hypothetical protein
MHNFGAVKFRLRQSQTKLLPWKVSKAYVYTFKDGTMVKVKTDWYKTLHHLKDSVNATRHLFEAVIDERIDDVKAMFASDQFTMDRIQGHGRPGDPKVQPHDQEGGRLCN